MVRETSAVTLGSSVGTVAETRRTPRAQRAARGGSREGGCAAPGGAHVALLCVWFLYALYVYELFKQRNGGAVG